MRGGHGRACKTQSDCANAGTDIEEDRAQDGRSGKSCKQDGARDGGRTRTAVKPRDFKSLVSTNFTTRAGGGGVPCVEGQGSREGDPMASGAGYAGQGCCRERWRLGSELNRRTRSCSPLHNHSATQPWGPCERTRIISAAPGSVNNAAARVSALQQQVSRLFLYAAAGPHSCNLDAIRATLPCINQQPLIRRQAANWPAPRRLRGTGIPGSVGHGLYWPSIKNRKSL